MVIFVWGRMRWVGEFRVLAVWVGQFLCVYWVLCRVIVRFGL